MEKAGACKEVCMKKIIRIILALAVVVMAGALPANADRGGHWGHGGGHFGHHGGHAEIVVGPGLWWPGWWDSYPYYPYYSSPPVIVQQPPEIYVQPTPQAEPSDYWYFCQDPKGYYPYVKKCPKGWLKVVPSDNPPE
jgi:hypothetical protein